MALQSAYAIKHTALNKVVERERWLNCQLANGRPVHAVFNNRIGGQQSN
jgi:hypothetical protein